MEQQPPQEPGLPPPAAEAAAWRQADADRRTFPWFADDRPGPDLSALPGADEYDRPVSSWSVERDLLDSAAIAGLVASGVDPDQARRQVETATDRERFERAVASGVNQEDATAAVDGAHEIRRLQAARRARETQQRQLGDFIAGALRRAEASGKIQPHRPTGDIAVDTNGELVPRYIYLERRADRLAPGDLLREPRFGEVRVALLVDGGHDEGRAGSLVQVSWTGDDGSRAARAYRPDDRLVVRTADLADVDAIHRALDRAFYNRTPLNDRGARLLAAQLQHGPGSGLYRLAVTGEIREPALAELAELAQAGRGYLRRWSAALQAYCASRTDPGPLLGFEDRQW